MARGSREALVVAVPNHIAARRGRPVRSLSENHCGNIRFGHFVIVCQGGMLRRRFPVPRTSGQRRRCQRHRVREERQRMMAGLPARKRPGWPHCPCTRSPRGNQMTQCCIALKCARNGTAASRRAPYLGSPPRTSSLTRERLPLVERIDLSHVVRQREIEQVDVLNVAHSGVSSKQITMCPTGCASAAAPGRGTPYFGGPWAERFQP